MAFSRRLTRRRNALSPELVSLLIVLVAGVVTAYWAAHRFGLDLSGIQTAAAVLGLDENTVSPPTVGYVEAQAPYCKTGQQPAFLNGMAALDRQVGNAMGNPVECEHAASSAGDTVQQTTTGLAAYDKSTNTVSFTDGYRHWALTSQGLVTWEGEASTPPTADATSG
jgi:hypothetical protein